MRIDCPLCGARDLREFVMFGDASVLRPDADIHEATAAGHLEAMFASMYLRSNPAGAHQEYWFHAAGCHRWLIVARDTRDHAVLGVRLAQQRVAGGGAEQP